MIFIFIIGWNAQPPGGREFRIVVADSAAILRPERPPGKAGAGGSVMRVSRMRRSVKRCAADPGSLRARSS
jgi:hypothetical protein